MSESESPESLKMVKTPRIVIFVLLAATIVALLALSFRGIRVVICEHTHVCYLTCEQYSSNNEIEVNPAELGSNCEDSELLRQNDLVAKIQQLLGMERNTFQVRQNQFTNDAHQKESE